jgi:hypothetical protein
MTTNIWFNHEGKKFYAKLALQNGQAKVIEAKDEEGRQVNPEFVQSPAVKAHKKITSWGELPECEDDLGEGVSRETEGISARGK